MAHPTVEHSPDGTLVHDTVRGDREVNTALKANGFRWSRNLEAWYLPRTWKEQTRWARVERLREQLGDRIHVQRTDTPRRSAADRELEKRERAEMRSVRLDERADRAEDRAGSAAERADQISDGIPLGQPVLVGHHSQRRHERDLERIQRSTATAAAESRYARDLRARAEGARGVASGDESIVTIGNRIESNEADLRGVRRRLASESAPGEDYRAQLERREAELVDQIDHDAGKVAAAGGVRYSRENVKPGDFVQVGSTWYPVVRSNAKSVSVPNAVFGADSGATRTTQWRNVADHLARREATPERVRELAATTSSGLPGIRERLALEADLLVTERPDSGGQTPPTGQLERSTRLAEKSQPSTPGASSTTPRR